MTEKRKSLDWRGIEERVRAAQTALDGALQPDAEKVQEVYRLRAEGLERRHTQIAASASTAVLEFLVGPERYALDLRELSEVIEIQSWTRVPGAPPEILGVFARRGDIRMVAQLGRLLGVETGIPDGRCTVLLVRDPEVGLAVDQVLRLTRVDVVGLQPVDATGSRYVQGRTPDGVLMLSTSALLTHPALHN